jgi:mitochondrial enoyl-[acyl-carrier protein] reductase / trans-2-enoyl-CoA reductase
MLEEFTALEEGDVVVQNGANSAVGRAVIEVARSRGIKTVNIIRDRPDLEKMKAALLDLGMPPSVRWQACLLDSHSQAQSNPRTFLDTYVDP